MDALIAIWWMLFALAMPGLGLYQLFWILFALVPTVPVQALLLTSDRAPRPNT